MARILFVQNFWFEYLGTMVLSSVLKRAGHSVDLIIPGKKESLSEALDRIRPDIVGVYCVSGSHSWALKIFKEVKESGNAFTIMGGPHPTYFPEIIETNSLDAVCIGEGEGAILELADGFDHKTDITSIRNLWIKSDGRVHKNNLRPLLMDLDDLPDPDRELYYKYRILRDSPSKHFITGRGCPFNCSFCCNKAYKQLYRGLGTMIRRANPEKVCREIKTVMTRYPLKSVRFDDEVFLLHPEWVIEFLNRYRSEVRLPFSCLIRADLTTEKLVKAMKDAGCYIAYFGIESGDDTIRNEVLGKQISEAQIRETASLLHGYGIKIGTFNMVGMPGESFDQAWKTVEINQQIRSDQPWCSIIQPYPGTELEVKAKKMGLLDPDYGVDQLQQSYFNNTVIRNPDADALVALQKLFYLAVKWPALSPWIKRTAKSGGSHWWSWWIFTLTYVYRYSKTYRMPVWELIKRAFLWKDNY